VPAGVDTGTRLQLAGQGEVGPGGGPPGDLYVEVTVTPHPVFSREGDHLACTLQVPMSAAALGTTVELETLDGQRTIEVPAADQYGLQATAFARAIIEGTPVPVPPEDAAANMRLIGRLFEAAGIKGPSAAEQDPG
jgi:molecular chaperone DnaJ